VDDPATARSLIGACSSHKRGAIRDNEFVSTPLAPSSRRRGALLLADISGYTSFLQGVSDAHRDLIVEADEPPPAYAMLSHLLDTIVVAIQPTFTLAKFEGDAVFAVAETGAADGVSVIDILRRCYANFLDELDAAGSLWTCTCDACSRIGRLDLKFVLHDGSFVAQSIAGHQELLGTDVNVVHRLLKNHAQELVGPVAYALITDAALASLAIPTDGMIGAEEMYADTLPIPVHVLALSDAPASVATGPGLDLEGPSTNRNG
jgi:hypothetical protein